MKVTDEQIVDYICSYVQKNGYSPSIREVGMAVGVPSPGSIKYRLGKLRERGVIAFDDGKPRTLRVVQQ